MAVPASDLGDLQLADWTKTGLFLPKMLKPSSSFEHRKHLHIKPFLEVGFPGGIIGIGLRTNFRVPLDANRVGRKEVYHFGLPFLSLEEAREHPPVRTSGWPVLVFDPPARFVPVSSLCPDPEGFEDFVIDRMKYVLADHVAVVQGPSANLRIQFGDEFSCCQVSALLDVVSDLGKEGLHVLLRGGNEELDLFPFLVPAYRLPKKVEALLDMRDDCFLRGELQLPF